MRNSSADEHSHMLLGWLRMAEQNESLGAIMKLLSDVEFLLRLSTTGSQLAHRGVDCDVALVALQGVAAYIEGHKARAVDDLLTAAEVISGLDPSDACSRAGYVT